MTDSYDDNAVDVGLSLDLIAEEIEAGLPLHADRLCEAFLNEEYYRARNGLYVARKESEEWIDYVRRPKRTSKITRRAIRVLARDLYSPGPTRKLEGDAAADAWLQQVYAANRIDAVMGQADRLATLNGVAAVQATATGRAAKPVLMSLWGAHEFCWWTWPDDPTEVWAVATLAPERRIERGYPQQRLRIEVWSRDEHRYYLTQWLNTPMAAWTSRATAYRSLFGVPAVFVPLLSGEPAGSGVNPYGVLPFAFVHDELPVSCFDEGGIGTPLRECNAEVDRELSDLADHTREFMDPDRFTVGVSATWRRERNRARWQTLTPSAAVREGDQGGEPKAFLVQGTLAVQDVWYNAITYANSTLEELDVPLIAVRADLATEPSGISIVARHAPLFSRTRQRQGPFSRTENDVAGVVLAVGGYAAGAAGLSAAATAPQLATVWPEPSFPFPSAERAAEDEADLQAGYKSQVQIAAERNGSTRDQAKEHLEQVLEDNQWYAELLKQKGLTTPDPLAPPTDPNQTQTQNQQPGATPPSDPADEGSTDDE